MLMVKFKTDYRLEPTTFQPVFVTKVKLIIIIYKCTSISTYI